ncbi:LysM peptidoglycan-binding domain-containing protein [Snodgrassella sp. ESL0324]|uniref:LysM peptidoglycan-binding domain-containing protein n=1 Tax=Snodgrassella sp. ESL0324 TaxID=2705033 RepID=UPI00158376D7|nr:LysM peptidoglycan-binding domain-containing protein [Snodgrassella sp. ESL0324]NUF08161.1 LysM peptidoglycan-binding domain-containing protein [Snodgrassella sp. ESL0324]
MHKHIITLLCALSMAISAPVMAKLKLRPDAPAQYVVKSGDTLWSISGKYLYSPWQWPQLWGSNRDQIRNPQKIYPGQVLSLRYVNGQPRLGFDNSGGIPTIKLQPQIRNLSSGYGISTIDVDFFRMFMQHPQVISKEQTREAPRLIAGPDNRVIYSTGDRIYADRQLEPGRYLIYRIEQNITDPDTHKYLGQLVRFSGEAATLAGQNTALAERSPKDAASLPEDEYYTRKTSLIKVPTRTAQPLVITNSASEINKGDYLLKITDEHDPFQMMPHGPTTQIKGKIVSVMDGIQEAGPYQTITLNLGTNDGVDKGTVVSLYKKSRQLKADLSNEPKKSRSVVKYLSIPAEEVGLALIYRVSDNLSSALIINASQAVQIGDLVMNPGHDLDDVTQDSTYLINSFKEIH